jgi:ribosomal protein S18 acetylase RimI-like enzyme
MQVVVLRQPDRIRPFLWADRFFADYALGDLDPAHFPFTAWFGAEEDGQLRTVVMLYNDLQPPILFALGEARGLEAILDRTVQLAHVGLSIREEHLPAIEEYYVTELVPMLKMSLLPEDFRPVTATSSRGALSPSAPTRPARIGRATKQSHPWPQENTSRSALAVARLSLTHLPQLEALYAHGGGDAFRQRSLALGVFYGVLDHDCLVSVAGTHIVSECERIAALGNVTTHPAYRGQGLATLATSAVCEELLERGIEMIGLSVGRSNKAAQRVYEKIGFQRRVPFYEGTAASKKSEAQL